MLWLVLYNALKRSMLGAQVLQPHCTDGQGGPAIKMQIVWGQKNNFGLVKNCIIAVSLVCREIFTFENKKLFAGGDKNL